MSDGDVAANGIQFGAPADLPGADMPAASAQRGVSGNVAHIDVPAARDGREVTCNNLLHLDVPAFRLQLGDGSPPRSISHSRGTDTPRLDVSTLSVQGSGAADVRRSDVTGLGDHLDVVSAWHRNLKLHPELCIRGARRLRRKRPRNFHSRIARFGLERVRIKKGLSGGAVRIGFDVHGVTHHGWRASVELNNIDGSEIRRQPQR